MSGIAGIYYPDGKEVDRTELTRMTDAIAHRGKDGVNFWQEANIGLAHRMLHTTAESLTENLPLVDSTKNYIITADARIDNREELLSQLQLTSKSSVIADSELILEAYIKWGKDCPDKLLGDFAFVIWDRKKKELFCARDHFGVKPFYYYFHQNYGFVFASEIKAILAIPEIPKEINEVRIGDYLTYTLDDPEITSFVDVLRLPSASTLVISGQSPKIENYWSLELQPEIKLDSDEEYASKFLEIFTEAVRCRLRSAFPIGSHLSGGLDSSSVTCIARNILKQQNIQLHTFSNVFSSVPESDESEYIHSVIEQGAIVPHFIHADEVGPLSYWQEMYKYFDESLIGNGYLIWGLNKSTEEAGVRVVLNGFDGDTTVSHGFMRLTELALQNDWQEMVNQASSFADRNDIPVEHLLKAHALKPLKRLAQKKQWLAFWQAVLIISQPINISPYRICLDYGLKTVIPDSFLKIWWRIRHGKPKDQDPFPLVKQDFKEKINLQARVAKFEKPTPRSVTEEQKQTFSPGLINIPLESMDIASGAFNIETRHPFMDKRLIDYCLALPAEQKLNNGWSRLVLRRAMENVLPPKIQWRVGKTSVTPAMIETLSKPDMLAILNLTNSQRISMYSNHEKLGKILEKTSNKEQKMTGKLITLLLPYVCLNLWISMLTINK